MLITHPEKRSTSTGNTGQLQPSTIRSPQQILSRRIHLGGLDIAIDRKSRVNHQLQSRTRAIYTRAMPLRMVRDRIRDDALDCIIHAERPATLFRGDGELLPPPVGVEGDGADVQEVRLDHLGEEMWNRARRRTVYRRAVSAFAIRNDGRGLWRLESAG